MIDDEWEYRGLFSVPRSLGVRLSLKGEERERA